MALDDLIARLEQDTDAQVTAIARAADEEIAAIVAAIDQALAVRARESLAAARHERRMVYARALADHRRELRATTLAERYTAIDRVFARARELVARGTVLDAWASLWPGIADEALSYVTGLRCRVLGAPAVVATLDASYAGHANVELVADEQVGTGLIIEACDGAIRIDATIETLLAQRREALSVGLLDPEVGDAA